MTLDSNIPWLGVNAKTIIRGDKTPIRLVVTGKTYEYREQLKEMGFYYDQNPDWPESNHWRGPYTEENKAFLLKVCPWSSLILDGVQWDITDNSY